MSGGKKRSGFQITSVTSDVGESTASKIPVTQDVNDSAPLLSEGPQRDSVHFRDQTTTLSTSLNGPAFLHTLNPGLLMQQSSSHPSTPVTMRKQRSLDQAVTGVGASRFRVVRLGQGLGEPYKRGRWTCVDVMEREPELHGVRRVLDSMRHAHSLESLETVGLGGAEGECGVTLKSLKELRAGHMVHLQGSAHLMAHSGPPSPTHTEHDSHLLSPPLRSPNTPCTRKIPPPLQLNMGLSNKVRATRSQPTSPGPPASRDGSFHQLLTPVQTPSALALAQSMFGVGGAFGLVSDESVRKMVSVFETRKQTRPASHSSPPSSTQNTSPNQQSSPPLTTPTPILKTLPCLSTTPEPQPRQTSGHGSSAHPLSHSVMSERCHDGEREKQDVVLRRGGEGRRIPRVRLRDSWPIGRPNCFEQRFLSFVTIETKEPISCSKCPPEFDKSRLRPIRCKSNSTTGLNTTSTAGLNSTSITGLNTTSITGLNTTSITGLNTSSTTGLNTTSTIGPKATSTTGVNTTSNAGINTASTTGLNTTSSADLKTASTTGLNTTSTTGLKTASTTGLNTNSTTGLDTTSTTGLNTTSTAGLNTTSITGLNTTSTTGPKATSTAGVNTTSNAGINTSSTTGLNTTSSAGLKTASTTGLNTTSTTGLNTTSSAGLKTASTTGLNTNSTTGLDTSSTTGLDITYTTGPKTIVGTNASSAIRTTASTARGTYSHFNTETSSKLTIGDSASANLNSEPLLSLGCRGLDLLGGANKSVFGPPVVPVYPKQQLLGNAVAVTQSGGRGQGKVKASQPRLGLRPSDSTFFSLLLLLRSESSNSMIAIDNKIEQAMDLVKAHLMLAVREEVEVLREQIKELAERNAQLERENYILRALRENQ